MAAPRLRDDTLKAFPPWIGYLGATHAFVHLDAVVVGGPHPCVGSVTAVIRGGSHLDSFRLYIYIDIKIDFKIVFKIVFFSRFCFEVFHLEGVDGLDGALG